MKSLRVLVFATRDRANPGAAGGDISIWEAARYLASVGHEVTFVASHFAGAKREEVIDQISVVRLGGILSLWFRTFAYYMAKCRGRFDVVVAEGFGGSRIPRFVPIYVKEPVVTEWHQIHDALFAAQYPRILIPPLRLLERLTANVHRETLVRAPTVEWQRAFPTIGFRPENVVLVPVSVGDEWLTYRPANQVRAPRIVWLGRFLRYKCPHHALLAMKIVLGQIPSAQLILAGRHTEPSYERELVRLAAELDISDSVQFRWDLSEREKQDLLRSSRVMVLPSSVEGFGIVVLEANSCGVPVVASTGVPIGAVEDGFNGLRYEFGDLPGLASALLKILIEDELHQRLSQNGLAFAARFDWASVGRQYEAMVQRAALTHRSVT